MAKASDNLFPYVHLVPAAAPASPAAGSQRLYLDSGNSNKLSRKDSSGVVVVVEGGGGSIPAWSSYTPTWSATSGTPAVGTGGSLTGSYQQLDKTVHFELHLVLGTTGMSTGTGTWSFSLPVAAAAAPSGVGQKGFVLGGYYEDFGTRAYASPGGRLKTSSTTAFELTYSLDSSTNPGSSNTIGATAPFTWGSSDYLSIFGSYKAA